MLGAKSIITVGAHLGLVLFCYELCRLIHFDALAVVASMGVCCSCMDESAPFAPSLQKSKEMTYQRIIPLSKSRRWLLDMTIIFVYRISARTYTIASIACPLLSAKHGHLPRIMPKNEAGNPFWDFIFAASPSLLQTAVPGIMQPVMHSCLVYNSSYQLGFIVVSQ